MMLQIAPTSWWSWDFTVSEGSRSVADLDTSWWREKGQLTVDGVTYRVYREAPMAGAFVLDGPRGEIARAEKPSAFLRKYVVRFAGRELTLRPRLSFKRAFDLLEGTRHIGSIAPENMFGRKAVADLPRDLPLAVRAFMVWLTVISWRRDSHG